MIKGKRAFLANLLFRSSGYRFLKKFEPKNLVIFNYHRIRTHDLLASQFDGGVYGPTEDELRAQLKWLRANTQIISEQELIDHVSSRFELPKSCAMVTFDDGYFDNATLALPILKELKIPAIFFISTESIEKRVLGWWDNIAYLVKQAKDESIWVRNKEFNLGSEREKTILKFQEWMRTERSDLTTNLVSEIALSCGVKLPESELASRELMSWEQIQDALASGMTIGSHTHTHRVLSTLSKNEQVEEFLLSKQILEMKLKTRIRSVAYPVGGHEDCNLETGSLASECGYELGFSFQTGFNQLKNISPFAVRRISSEESIPLTCAAASLPTIFARSKTGKIQARPIASGTSKKRVNPRLARQTFLWILIISLGLGPTWPSAVANSESNTAANAAASTTVNDGADEATSDSNGATLIAPGFKIRLICPSDSKLNGDFRVTGEGELSLPYNMSIRTTGLKLKALEAQLKRIYKPYFKGVPQIRASIVQKRYLVKVTGVVKNPGTYLLKEHSTLDEALAMAAIRTEDLATGYVRLGVGNHGRWISMDDYMKGGPARDLPPWRGGEQILFQLERPEGDSKVGASEDSAKGPSDRKIQVLGEVKNPGAVSFQQHADGYYYLIERGGPTQFSNLDRVELIRRDPKTNEHKQVSLGDLGSVKEVRESDVIIIHPDRPSSFDKTLQSTGIIAAIVSSIVLTIFVVRSK